MAVYGLTPGVGRTSVGGTRLVRLPDLGPPAGSEVRVRMLCAPVNPADLLMLEGRYPVALDARKPMGAEGVGRVEAVGPMVQNIRPGMLVLPLQRGNWCTHRMLDCSALVPVPPGVDVARAAMLRINPVTAMLLLQVAAVSRGGWLLQNAAGSTVAAWVRLFAAKQGVRVVNIVRRATPAVADAIIDGPDLPEKIRERTGGQALDAVLDCVAGHATARLAACLAPQGRVIVFGHLSGLPVTLPSQLLTGGALTVQGFSLRPAEAAIGWDGVRALFDRLWQVDGRKPLSLPVAAVFPMEQAGEALARARKGGGGRVQLDLAGVISGM